MKHNLIFSLLACIGYWGQTYFAQHENKKWYFGHNAALDFLTNPPTPIAGSAMHAHEGCGSISDAAGNLLFYTNGSDVWNKNNVIMANGSGLLGYFSSTQSGLIVKKPGSTNLYYIFTLAYLSTASGLHYSIVDMSLAAGMGSVTVKNTYINTFANEKVAAIRHCNGTDIWILSHQGSNTNNYLAYLLSSTGINTTPVISSAGNMPTFANPGQMKVSPNRKKLAVMNYNVSVELLDFDPSSGVISNPLTLTNTPNQGYGIEFSPDGSKLYASAGALAPSPSWLCQWDLCQPSQAAIIASATLIATTVNLAGMQVAPNGKIYIASPYSSSLSVINNPNSAGAACNYAANSFTINPGQSIYGLPYFFPDYAKSLPAFSSTVINCQPVQFAAPPAAQPGFSCAATAYILNGLEWNFGDAASGSSNTSMLTNPSHDYSSAGTFTAQLILKNYCGNPDTIRQVIMVNGITPVFSVSGSTAICAGETATLNASGSYTYSWSSPGSASAASGPSLSISPNITSIYTVTASSGVCTTAHTVELAVNPLPVFTVSGTTPICSGATATLHASGPYTYSWSSPGSASAAHGASLSVKPTTTGIYTVMAGSGTCSKTQTIQLQVNTCLGISLSVENDTRCRIYPNPLSSELTVETETDISLQFFDLYGNLLLEKTIVAGTEHVDTSWLKNGSYFIKIKSSGSEKVIKVLKE